LKRIGVVVSVALVLGAVRYAQSDANPSAGPNKTSHVQLGASAGLDSVLVRSCGDCHSNTPSSHWSSRVPPVSWIMERGAREGRKAVNFAEWSKYSPEQQHAFLVASCVDAKSGRMPMAAYLRFRPDAKLSSRDVETICGASR
jgi:hypothetical protein